MAVFIWLAWAGWNEYQKIEAYRRWAAQFERAKYDIYAVLGQNGHELTWGKPTRTGPVNLQTFSLQDIESIRYLVNGHAIALDRPPPTGRAVLEFIGVAASQPVQIPFTEPALAAKWAQVLQQDWQRIKGEERSDHAP
jgi:hypothetical protein